MTSPYLSTLTLLLLISTLTREKMTLIECLQRALRESTIICLERATKEGVKMLLMLDQACAPQDNIQYQVVHDQLSYPKKRCGHSLMMIFIVNPYIAYDNSDEK